MNFIALWNLAVANHFGTDSLLNSETIHVP